MSNALNTGICAIKSTFPFYTSLEKTVTKFYTSLEKTVTNQELSP